MILKKTAAVFLCTLTALISVTGCSSKEESSEEIYYGQAYKEVNAKDIYRIYDGRFITDEEADAVAKYFYSVQTQDYELFASTQPAPYLEFLNMQKEGYTQDYLSTFYNDEMEGIGGDFEYTQLEITDCGNKDDDHSLSDISEMLDGIYEDAGEDKLFSETVKDQKYIKCTLTAIKKGDETSAEFTNADQILYVFTCENGIYIL